MFMSFLKNIYIFIFKQILFIFFKEELEEININNKINKKNRILIQI